MELMRQKEEEERLRQEDLMRQIEELKQTRQSFVDKTKEILKLPQVCGPYSANITDAVQIVEEKKPRAAGGGGGGGGRKRREQGEDFVNDSSDLGEYNLEPGEQRPRKKLKVDYVVEGKSGDLPFQGEKRRRRERREGSVSSEEGGEREEARLKKKKKKRVEDEETPARMRGKSMFVMPFIPRVSICV